MLYSKTLVEMNKGKMKKILINTPQQAPMQVDENGDTLRQVFGPVPEKKDWHVTLTYNIRHNDTYLITNETKENAIWIAENQNTSPLHECICIKEEESDIEDEETTTKEVVFNSEKKKWLDKESK